MKKALLEGAHRKVTVLLLSGVEAGGGGGGGKGGCETDYPAVGQVVWYTKDDSNIQEKYSAFYRSAFYTVTSL